MEQQWRNPRGDPQFPRSIFTTIATQRILSLGKLSRLEHLRRGGFVTYCGLRVLRALRDLGRSWFSWATAGVRPCATLTPRTSSRRFSSTLACSLTPAKKGRCAPVSPLFIPPRAHVMPPPLVPSGLASATRGLSWKY